jgi:hypothetical protein
MVKQNLQRLNETMQEARRKKEAVDSQLHLLYSRC